MLQVPPEAGPLQQSTERLTQACQADSVQNAVPDTFKPEGICPGVIHPVPHLYHCQ